MISLIFQYMLQLEGEEVTETEAVMLLANMAARPSGIVLQPGEIETDVVVPDHTQEQTISQWNWPFKAILTVVLNHTQKETKSQW